MKHILSISALFIVCLVGCKSEKRYRTATGLEYILYPASTKDSIARMGQTVKVNFTQKVGDSILETTYDKMPFYWMVMPGYGNRYNPLEVFDYGLRKGDSVVTIQLVDSMLKKKIFEKLPPWMKKEDHWMTYMKVTDVFTSDSLLQLDKAAATKRVLALQTSLGKKRITDYLANNKISVDERGDCFVQTMRLGSGIMADSGSNVKAILHVQTLKDTILTKQDTVSFISSNHFFPPAIDACILSLPNGTRIRIYIPAVAVVGVTPSTKKVKVNDDLYFEIELLSVK